MYICSSYYCVWSVSVDTPRGQVNLSLRLSHTDPAAAKRERRRQDRERVREGGGGGGMKASSDGESAETDRYIHERGGRVTGT